MSDQAILQDIVDAVKLAVAASTNPTLPIAHVAVKFDPPQDQKYLEIVFIPNNPADRYHGEEQVYQGVVRLILHWPNNGQGASAPMILIENIIGYFGKSERYGNVQIYNTPKLAQDKEMLYPATMRYRSFQ